MKKLLDTAAVWFIALLYIELFAPVPVTAGIFNTRLNDLSECMTGNLTAGHYPSCTDCSKFIKCDGSNSGLFSCPAPLSYDVIIGVCQYPQFATCGGPAEGSTVATSSENLIVPVFSQCASNAAHCVVSNLEKGQYPHCTDCSKSVRCNGIFSVVEMCINGRHYDVNLGRCIVFGAAVCGTRGVSSPPTTSDNEVSNPSSSSSSIAVSSPKPTQSTIGCVSGPSDCTNRNLAEGQYPVCDDCAMFVMCSSAVSANFTCSPGLLYDVRFGVCNFIKDVDCGTFGGSGDAANTVTAP